MVARISQNVDIFESWKDRSNVTFSSVYVTSNERKLHECAKINVKVMQ